MQDENAYGAALVGRGTIHPTLRKFRYSDSEVTTYEHDQHPTRFVACRATPRFG